MSLRIFGVLTLVLLTGACVTTGPTGDLSPPDDEEAARLNMELGVSYFQQGKFEEALAKLHKSIEEDPSRPSAYRVLALVYLRLGDSDRAEASYREAVSHGRNDQAALNDLAVYLCRQEGGYREALGLFNRAIEAPEYQYRHEVLTNAGKCAKQFDLAKAEEYLRRAISLEPQFPEALYHMADVAYQAEKHLAARAFIERCLAETAAVPDLLYLAWQIESALGDKVAAQTYRSRLLADFPGSGQAQKLMEQQSDRG